MAKKKEEQKQEEKTVMEEVGVNPTNDIEQEKLKTKETQKKCGRCGAELISGKTECPVCLAPVNWER